MPSSDNNSSWANPSDEVIIDLKKFSIFPPSRAKPIVYEFNMSVRKGALVALMGDSGCGKTTLMIYLTRRMRNPYTDWGVTAERHVLPRRVAFVAQKELFFPYDTAVNHLMFLRQRHFVESRTQSLEKVHQTLRLVGLLDESKWGVQIGEAGRESTLSGGERRLLTVASALVTEPTVVILDEPTSGMDGYTAMKVIEELRSIAQVVHTTFIVSIHQPSDKLLAVFDYVERMYPPTGPFQRAAPISGKEAGGGSSERRNTQNANRLPSNDVEEMEGMHAPDGNNCAAPIGEASTLHKVAHLFSLYLWRAFLRCWTNWRAGPLRLAASLIFAIMCGVAWVNLDFHHGNFLRDILGFALAIIGLSFAPILLNATLFVTERDTLLEEHVDLDHVALLCDSIARWATDIVLGATAALFLMIAIPIVGVQHAGWYFLTMWLQAWAADSFGTWISMIAPPHIAIGIVIPTVGFLSIAIGTGLMQPEIQNEGYIFHVCKWASFFKYGFQALLIKELPEVTIPCTQNCIVSTGVDMLDVLHLSGDGYEVTMGFQYLMLFVFTIVLRVLAFFTVRALILIGNRRYSYDNSGAAASSPAEESAQATSAAAAEGAHEPVGESGANDDEHALNDDDNNDVPPVDPASGNRLWRMAPVELEPSLVAKASACLRKDEQSAQKKVLLNVLDFSIHPRETVAVMGPTGSGKSLLLSHLSSRLGEGVSTAQPTQFFSTCSACRKASIQLVDGNDSFLPNLTVFEPVRFHATLYDNCRDEMLNEFSAAQLIALGIGPEKHNHLAFTLSGGQMRRLSVACKTVLQPAVLLLDEPTSGLDHVSAINLGRHLRRMAKEDGVGVICTLQQPEPELLNCFDTFVFMREGRVVVRGSKSECRTFLGIPQDSPSWAEDALFALAKDTAPQTTTSDDNSIDVTTHLTEPNSAQRIFIFHAPRQPLFICVKELAGRSLTNGWIRAPWQTLTGFMIRYLLLPVALSVLLVNVGSKDPMYFNRSGLLFVYAACVSFSSLLKGAVTFPTERRMVEQEINANLYSTTAYLLSQWYPLPLLEDLIGSMLGSIALKYVASLEANLGIIFAVTLTLSQCCEGIGYICGLFRDLPVASGLTVLVLMPFLIGGNVVATTEQVTRIPLLHVFEALSSVRYGYLIMFYNELVQGTGSVVSAKSVFAMYGLKPEEKWFQSETLWPVFVFYAVFVRILALLLYRRLICPSCVAGQ